VEFEDTKLSSWAMRKYFAIALACLFVLSTAVVKPVLATSPQYLATIHHPLQEKGLAHRRSVSSQFIGDLDIDTTVNSEGEITIGLCDINQGLFGGVPAYHVFQLDQSASVEPVASADLSIDMEVKMQIDGCLEFFFNPCCETFGVRFRLNDPILLSATGSFEVDLEAFGSLGIKIGDSHINFSPLNNISLGGFAPKLGEWLLPPVLDTTSTIASAKTDYCASLSVPGDSSLGISFCVILNNLTTVNNGVTVCPRLTLTIGSQTLLDLSYTGTNGSCLHLSYVPLCQHSGSTVAPTIVQLFKSIDVDNDYKFTLSELNKLTGLLGISSDSSSFSQMDSNKDGTIDFTEFQNYTKVQATQDPNSGSSSKQYSPGDIALAVTMTLIGTTIVVSAILLVFAQYKGMINLQWLGKVVPTKL